jgi:hypothetical protein
MMFGTPARLVALEITLGDKWPQLVCCNSGKCSKAYTFSIQRKGEDKAPRSLLTALFHIQIKEEAACLCSKQNQHPNSPFLNVFRGGFNTVLEIYFKIILYVLTPGRLCT